MSENTKYSSIEWWLDDIRLYFSKTEPKLLPLLDIYAAEAIFGRNYIASDLESLPSGAKILEIGAGSLLLSCQLAREGFQITALEPIGQGFSHFEQMRQIILARATAIGCLPTTLNLSAETLTESKIFDFAFSINVMEHVADIACVIANVGKSLKVGATYRFTAPNYLFPYEPHFNIPTLFSKKLTEKIFKQKIFNCKKNTDPAGTWLSLNWITVIQVRKIVRQFPALKVTFNRHLLVATIQRITSDPIFSNRRSLVIRNILSLLVKLRMHHFFRFIPAEFQPIMDCQIQKTSDFVIS